MADLAPTNESAGRGAELPLSQEGLARRDAMLGALLSEVPRAALVRRRRRAALSASGALAAIVVAGLAWSQFAPGRRHAPIPSPVAAAQRIEIVPTDRLIVARLAGGAPSPGAARVERISDDELLRTLSTIGRPAGLASLDGRVRLTANVADRLQTARGSAL